MWRLRTKNGIVAIFLALIVAAAAWYFISSTDTAAPPLINTPPAALPQTAKKTAPPTAANETDRVILSLFDAQIDDSGLAFEQRLRERYRNAYIGIFLLQACDTDIRGYHQSLASALQAEWAKQNLTPPPQQDINTMLTAIMEEASSSYSMLYANTPCDKRNLPAFIDFFEKLEH